MDMIEIGRDKADLKAVRESIGIGQPDLADEMRVTVRTIKRWEQIGWEEPPEELWELLEDMVHAHEKDVDELVRHTEEQAQRDAAEAEERERDPKTVYLAYYKNQKHYEHFATRRHTTHTWGNAIVRRAADILRLKGYHVFFYYPETDGEADKIAYTDLDASRI